VYKGIEFVCLQELPTEQQFLLQAHHTIERIKILIDEKIVSDCIQYKHYEAWYTESFVPFKKKATVTTTVQPVFPALALDKI
jgi:hypothetical protein